MVVSAGGGPNPQDRYEVRGVDPDEARTMFVPHWVVAKAMRGVLPPDAVRRLEERLLKMIRDRLPCVVEDEQRVGGSRVPRWVQFVACDALVESKAVDMPGRYADVERVLDAFRDDEGLREAIRAACMIGGAPAVRQFVAGTFFEEDRGERA